MRALVVFVTLFTAQEAVADPRSSSNEVVHLRAWGVPDAFGIGPDAEADQLILAAFRARFPNVDPVSPTGLLIPGSTRTTDMVPFMQIAGDVAPDVLSVILRQSQTYVQMQLLYPLDHYVEQSAGATIGDSGALTTDQYVAELRKGAMWNDLSLRVPPQLWPVIRSRCPERESCRYRRDAAMPPREEHFHVWIFPMKALVTALVYDRALFAEHIDEGIEQRAPRDWEELLRWAKILTNPPAHEFGISVNLDAIAHTYLKFLYGAGGRVLEENDRGEWRCTLDTEAAVEAAYFFARLKWEKVERGGRTYRGVLAGAQQPGSLQARIGMKFEYLDDRVVNIGENKGIGPTPQGPGGQRATEFNAQLCGIFAGIGNDVPRRDAAWNYILFYDGPEARRIRVEKAVEAGLGPYVRPDLLRHFNIDGRFDDVLRQIPRNLEETYRVAMENGIPEPYGTNCQYVYDQMNKPLGVIWSSAIVRDAIDANQPDVAKAEIRRVLADATVRINRQVLGQLPQSTVQRRIAVSWVLVAIIAVLFVYVLWIVSRNLTTHVSASGGQWQFSRYAAAYVLLAPALVTIALWAYWPVIKGSVIAFQDYKLMGGASWIGAANFSEVFFDPDFWHSLRVSLMYAALFIFFGFWTPIALAFLLQEVPVGSLFFRIVYYLPAILSGVVVIFLWKSFYGPDGFINQLINSVTAVCNGVFGSNIAPLSKQWLDDPKWALLACLLPTIWAGLGPGCLIYLAALKTVPEEFYEAADIDGAGIWQKIVHIALPSIKTLVVINLIGAVIGAIRGSGGFVLAMTGGGPYTDQGGATEVIGLKLFYTTFGYVKFGTGAAMAWIIGAMLIGFTALQLQRLSKLEFRTSEKVI